MRKTGNSLEIHIADLKPEVQAAVLELFDVSFEDKNYRQFLYGKPICILPDALTENPSHTEDQ